jgi:hypothetical protein
MTLKKLGITALVLAVPLGLWFGWCSHSTAPSDGSAAQEVSPQAGAAGKPWQGPIGRMPSRATEHRRLRLAGQVIGMNGAGVAGAEVSLSGASPRTVRSAADGTFTFEDVDAGESVIRATAGDLTGGPVPVHAPGDPVLIRLDLGAALVVHVVEGSGRPVADAEVGLVDDPSRLVRTDAAGLAALSGVPAGTVGVTVSGAGYATSEVTAGAAPGMKVELTVTLRQGYAVSGAVIDGAGRPVAGAQVGVRGGLGGIGIRGARAVTDAEGRFTVAALGAGTHTLVASDGEHAPTEAAPVTITDQPIAGVRITLKEGGVIDGQVTQADAAPVRAATVRVVGGGPSPVRELRTDEQGRFSARGLPSGLVQLQAESDGATSDVMDVDLASTADRPEVRLVLDAAGSIAGVVVDSQGHPVAGAQVTAYPDAADDASRPSGISRAAPATTDRGGAFQIRGLHPGNYRLFATGAPGLRNPVDRGIAAAAGDSNVRIALVAGGALRGSLRSSKDGASPAHAELQLGQRAPVSITGGTIDLPNIPPGTYDVAIRGAEFAELVRHGVAIRDGQTTDLGTIELSAGRILVGTVVDGRGAPVEGARIQLTASSVLAGAGARTTEDLPGAPGTTSDHDGQFTLRGVPAAAASVSALHPRRGRSIAQAIAADTADPAPVVLVLRGFGSVTGTVAAPDPSQARTVITMMPRDNPGQPRGTRAADDGSFRFAEVPEGPYTVSATQTQSGSMRTANATVDVVAGAETQVALDFPRGPVTLSVQVEPPPGGTAAGATVFLLRGGVAMSTEAELMQITAGGRLAGMKPWHADGEPLRFEELTPGSYSVCAVATRAFPSTGGTTRSADRAASPVACRRIEVAAAPGEQIVSCPLTAADP